VQESIQASYMATMKTTRHDERSKRDMSVTTSVTGAIRNLVCL